MLTLLIREVVAVVAFLYAFAALFLYWQVGAYQKAVSHFLLGLSAGLFLHVKGEDHERLVAYLVEDYEGDDF